MDTDAATSPEPSATLATRRCCRFWKRPCRPRATTALKVKCAALFKSWVANSEGCVGREVDRRTSFRSSTHARNPRAIHNDVEHIAFDPGHAHQRAIGFVGATRPD